MKHKDGSTDKHKDKHKEKRREEKVIKKISLAMINYFVFWVCFFSTDHELSQVLLGKGKTCLVLVNFQIRSFDGEVKKEKENGFAR